MVQAPTSPFEDAESHLAETGERQREVLRLIARGHTNPEIADRLGITLDGAKWHVSELLGKLGLESREELADFWAWHQRPARRIPRMVRALVAVPAFKVAGGLVGIVVIAAAGFGVWSAFNGSGGDSGGSGMYAPFVLQAEITVDSTADTTGTSLNAPPDHTESRLTLWHESTNTWKWELTTDIGKLDQQTMVITSNDGHGTAYNSLTNSYSKADLQRLPDGTVVPPVMSSFLGPVGSYAKTPDAFVAMLRQSSGGDPPRQAEIVGSDTVLGRHTVIIETPASYSSGSDGAEASHGTMRMWLDPERMMVLKTASTGTDQSYAASVTSLDWDARLTQADLSFQPPAGATQTAGPVNDASVGQSGGSSSSSGGLSVHPPAGFVLPSYVPDGFGTTESGQRTTVGSDRPVTFTVRYTNDIAADYFSIQETIRMDGLPGDLKAGDAVKVNRHDAWLTTDGDGRSLAWAQDGLAIMITAHGLTTDELMKVASSMQAGGSDADTATAAGPSPVATRTVATPVP